MAGRIVVAGLAAALAAGCGGGAHRLGDGQWYGAVAGVDGARRTVTFAAACKSAPGGGWLPAAQRTVTLPLAPRARFAIYYRPNGDAAAGHSQAVGLRLFRQVVREGRPPDFPAGWIATVRAGVALSVEEDSGLLELHAPACR